MPATNSLKHVLESFKDAQYAKIGLLNNIIYRLVQDDSKSELYKVFNATESG